MQATGTPRSRTRLAEHAEATEIGDVENDDQVGLAEFLHRRVAAIDARQIMEEEVVAFRSRRRVGDNHVAALGAQQVREAGLTAQPVSVGIDMGGETDPLAG